MASKKYKKKKNTSTEETISAASTEAIAGTNTTDTLFGFLSSFKQQLILLLAVSFAFYFNSIYNEYALDDDIVLNKNQYVQDGIKGIGDIMSKDAYDSFYRSMQAGDQLSGGRYRPLSLVTFAFEEEFFGFTEGTTVSFTQNNTEYTGKITKTIFDEKEVRIVDANGKEVTKKIKLQDINGFKNLYHIRHLFNVLYFVLSVGVLFYLLYFHLLKNYRDVAFLTALLFAIHPIHTEVVANVKSRDEIFSLLFICMTFIFAFRWREVRKKSLLILACAMYFLALLSKEWGITMVALIPIAFVIIYKDNISSAVIKSFPFFIIAAAYLAMRVKFVGLGNTTPQEEILNNPYLYATGTEKAATKIVVLLKYLSLQFFPYPLSADYSYKTIAYRTFGSWDVLLSLIVHGAILFYAMKLFFKKHILSFALFFYLGHLALVSNFLFDIGATMGERLIYHSSLGFCMAASYWIVAGLNKINDKKIQQVVLFPIIGILVFFFASKTIERNREWKNDHTLFIRDAKHVTESIMANGNAGKSFLEKAALAFNEKDSVMFYRHLDSAEFYLIRSFKNHPNYYIGRLNMGYIWFLRKDYEKAEEHWNIAASVFPRQGHDNLWKRYDEPLAQAFHIKGLQAGGKKDFESARKYIEKAVAYQPRNSTYWADLGGAYFSMQKYDAALKCWEQALALDPSNAPANGGYKAITGKDYPQK